MPTKIIWTYRFVEMENFVEERPIKIVFRSLQSGDPRGAAGMINYRLVGFFLERKQNNSEPFLFYNTTIS